MNSVNRYVALVVCTASLLFVAAAVAQLREAGTPTPAGAVRLHWFDEHTAMKENSYFKNYAWRFIGPQWMGGRVADIASHPDEPFTIYVAAASGGLWKTVNEGTTWKPLFDDQPSSSFGDIAIAPSDPSIVWAGTGERISTRNAYAGTGVYKSTDGGVTWLHRGLEDSNNVGRIVIHPENPDIVYVAVLGSLYSYNRQRGIYKTVDGGETWHEVLFINDQTGFVELTMDPSNPDILYAAAWDRLRRGWEMWEYGPGTGLYKTVDGGASWNQLKNGFPDTGLEGRIGIAVSPSNPQVVYATLDNHDVQREAEAGELDPYGFEQKEIRKGLEVYRSNDGGESWEKVNGKHLPDVYFTYGYVFGEIFVHPRDENKIWVQGVPLIVSTDGGKTFEQVPDTNVHGDFHAMWIDPRHPDRMIVGNDGGINITYDGGQNWKDIANLPVVQFYHINVDMARPFNIYGTAQDHGCFRGPVNHDVDGDAVREWKFIPGGEASYLAVDPLDPDILYHDEYYGRIRRGSIKTGESTSIKPEQKEGEEPLRNTWLTPFFISPHNPFTLYYGSQYVHRSLDRGETWQTLSPDLTDNDPARRGDVPFGAITTLSESPVTPGVVWAGTDDGNVHVTPDGGCSWITVQGLEDKWVSRVEASHSDPGAAYVSLNGYRDDDFNVYLYKVTDFGKTVTSIGGGIPGGPVNVIREDPRREHTLYAGTDTGVYISLDDGATWDTLAAGMPRTFVHDLIVHPRDGVLVAATHGRGIYVLDVSPVQQFNNAVKTDYVHLFDSRPVEHSPRLRIFPDAPITFTLAEAAAVQIRITDENGAAVWEENFPGERGFNRAVWNLHSDDGSRGTETAEPGMYTVTVQAGDHTARTVLDIR